MTWDLDGFSTAPMPGALEISSPSLSSSLQDFLPTREHRGDKLGRTRKVAWLEHEFSWFPQVTSCYHSGISDVGGGWMCLWFGFSVFSGCTWSHGPPGSWQDLDGKTRQKPRALWPAVTGRRVPDGQGLRVFQDGPWRISLVYWWLLMSLCSTG